VPTPNGAPATLALDLPSVQVGQRQNIWLMWYNNGTYAYNHALIKKLDYNSAGSFRFPIEREPRNACFALILEPHACSARMAVHHIYFSHLTPRRWCRSRSGSSAPEECWTQSGGDAASLPATAPLQWLRLG
jgi:hypothetical protein